jgi:hypothetical protein
MTTTNAQRETEITRMLGPGRRRPLILTARERRLVGVRIRKLKREVIPPLLRAMQSPNPDPRDREAYHRANNELDWLLEIALHSAGANGSGSPPRSGGGTRSSASVKRRTFHDDLAPDEVEAGATQPREPATLLGIVSGREEASRS